MSKFGSFFAKFTTSEAEERLSFREVCLFTPLLNILLHFHWDFFFKRTTFDIFLHSAKEPSQVAVARECPLVPEQVHTSSADPKPGLSSQNSFINLSVATVPPLHHCVSSHCSPSAFRPVCLSHVPLPVSVSSCCQHCEYSGESAEERSLK